jgi:putative membrane protein
MPITNRKDAIELYLKGIAMGAADIVPGVSGGTIAFISGIYEELIDSIGSIGPKTFKILFKDGIAAAWKSINGTFLLTLMLGILSSVFALSTLISGLLESHPQLLWSFFFGLIVISAIHIARQIKGWSSGEVIAIVLGTVVAYGITSIAPAQMPMNPLTIFFAGAIAICAMILPGISGSFILLLLGMYANILGAVKSLDILTLMIFSAGCLSGLLLFTRFLSWLLHHHHGPALAVLTGFMIGSLNKVWPWKQTTLYTTNSHGDQIPLLQSNLLPQQFLASTGQDPQVIACLLLMGLGVIVVVVLERVAKARKGS